MARTQLKPGDPEEFVGVRCTWCGWFTTVQGWLNIERCRRTDGKNDCYCTGELEDLTRAEATVLERTHDRSDLNHVPEEAPAPHLRLVKSLDCAVEELVDLGRDRAHVDPAANG